MRKTDNFIGIFISVVLGFVIGFLINIYGTITYNTTYKSGSEFIKQSKELVQECEKSLPRSQSCEIILVAKIKQEK